MVEKLNAIGSEGTWQRACHLAHELGSDTSLQNSVMQPW